MGGAIVFDYSDIGKRYRLLSDRWVPTISQTESEPANTVSSDTDDTLTPAAKYRADVRSVIDRIRASGRSRRVDTGCADDCCHPDHRHN